MTVKYKQPKGMYVLAYTEVFERLSFYTLSYLLVLYASAPLAQGGLGWSNERSLALMGIYTMAAFTLPIIGSFIADRFIGRRVAVFVGGLTIILGHFLMLFSSHEIIFYAALICVASGTGFFKPCMPSLLGDLYSPHDQRREAGFSWYYFGINVGGMAAGFSSGILLQNFGYGVALSSAGVGMIIGMLVFYFGKKHVVLEHSPKAKKISRLEKKPLTAIQIKSLLTLIITFLFFSLWTVSYNITSSGTLSLYIEKFTEKSFFGYDIPTTFFMSLESLTILIFTPILTYTLSILYRKNKYPHFFSQINLAMFISAIALFYFTYLSFISLTTNHSEKPFHYLQIILFIIAFSISETMISPVMMSAISRMAPLRYKSLFQSFYLAIFGITSLVAAKIGTYSLKEPFKTFLFVSITILIGAIVFYFIKGKFIKIANDAAKEENKKLSN
ncbi:MAG: MFS transporter [Spirobacillus cienkowskii]|jgi:POT family proton-dependent oligopeptide transporter|uniref:MFS transporter n=1 Tax=Spirobacillus cienkowskii TaxID=495820 RepID=A0A369KT28_9BACT|nr:MAG: MFS transporter [Spirobacillus cienkowskii]